jgi:hypothetical protein
MAVSPSASLPLAGWAQYLCAPIAELELRLEPDALHPERCWRATRPVIRPVDHPGFVIHPIDDEARAIGWKVHGIPERTWAAANTSMRDTEHSDEQPDDAQDTEQSPADEQPAKAESADVRQEIHSTVSDATRAKMRAAARERWIRRKAAKAAS